MKALKGSQEEKALLQRYTHQLDEQEDRLAALRSQIADLTPSTSRPPTSLTRSWRRSLWTRAFNAGFSPLSDALGSLRKGVVEEAEKARFRTGTRSKALECAAGSINKPEGRSPAARVTDIFSS